MLLELAFWGVNVGIRANLTSIRESDKSNKTCGFRSFRCLHIPIYRSYPCCAFKSRFHNPDDSKEPEDADTCTSSGETTAEESASTR